ncbi:MAG: lactonase family protein [Bacteroidota bacterium]
MKWNQIPALLLISLSIASCSTSNIKRTPQTLTFFVGTATDLPTEGIYAYTLNVKTGETTFLAKQENIINPSFLAISPNNQLLYALERKKDASENTVKAYAIAENGTLDLLNQQSTKGQGACYISTSKTGENVFIAHYGSGSVVNLPVRSDGSLGEVLDFIQYEGSSIDPKRQKSPHAHYIRRGLGDLVYTADLGTDKVHLYRLEEGHLVPNEPTYLELPKGAGPRHLAHHPNSKFLYVMNEMGGSVSVFAYDRSRQSFEMQQTISSLPTNFEGFNKSADIHVHPSGRFLYASNRGDHDSIAAFKIDEQTGQLSLMEIEKEAIVWPRNFAISPDGKYLLCANLKEDSISVFVIDEKDGRLQFSGNKIAVPKPLCIQFLD